MIRSIALAALVACSLAVPASADVPNPTPATATERTGSVFTEQQAREHLMRLGYTNVSALDKDANGKWVGTATSKDGKVIPVAVDVKHTPTAAQ